MELPGKISEKITFNTKPQTEEHKLIDMDKSTNEENVFPPLQTNNKQFKVAITFLTAYNGIFDITTKKNLFHNAYE